jgi:hypothetical protein
LVDSKSKEDKSKELDTIVVVKPCDVQKSISEITKENYARLIDVFIKIQPLYTQAISNLQSDCIESIKKIIEASFLTQEYLLFTKLWNNTPLATIYIQQSDSMTNNIIRSLHTATLSSINALEAARDSLETCRKGSLIHFILRFLLQNNGIYCFYIL